EPKSGLLDHQLWLAVALPGIAFVVAYGDWPLRVVAAAVCIQFALYLPYGDLVPIGVWRYQGIHYFKWTFPYLALFAWYALVSVFSRDASRPKIRILWMILLAAGTLLLLSLRLQVDSRPVEAVTEKHEIVVPLPDDPVNLVDVRGLGGGFSEAYLGAH